MHVVYIYIYTTHEHQLTEQQERYKHTSAQSLAAQCFATPPHGRNEGDKAKSISISYTANLLWLCVGERGGANKGVVLLC